MSLLDKIGNAFEWVFITHTNATLIVLFIIWRYYYLRKPIPEIIGSKVRSINSMEEFDDIVNGSTVFSIIDFYATWCPPCRRAAPIFAKMSMESDYSHIQFLKVNVNIAKDVARYFQVSAMPTFVLLQGTNTVIETQVGWSENNVRNMLNNKQQQQIRIAKLVEG